MKKRVVIKLGGSALEGETTLQALAGLVRACQERREQVFVVHGGGPAINSELSAQGLTWTFVDGQRQTTAEMMNVIESVLGEKVNSRIVAALQLERIKARGFSGFRDRIFQCTSLREELGLVGRIEAVRARAFAESAIGVSVPVIAPLGFGREFERFNINADSAAAALAVAIKADELIFLTDQKGILDSDGQRFPQLTPQDIDRLIESGVIRGGMSAKAKAMKEALLGGVSKIRVLHAQQGAQALEDESLGTILKRDSEQRKTKGLNNVDGVRIQKRIARETETVEGAHSRRRTQHSRRAVRVFASQGV